MQYRLRTLMGLTAVGPPLLALVWHVWPALAIAVGLLAVGFLFSLLVGVAFGLAFEAVANLVQGR